MEPDAEAHKSRRGRPTRYSHEERESMILDAMERIAAAKGLQHASMAAIAREAGMSKRTIYAVHRSRDALFEAWVRRLRTWLIRPVAPEERNLPIKERLRRMLSHEACGGVSQSRLNVLRAIVSESQRHPELARAFLREGPRAACCMVRDELERAVASGEIAVDDIDDAAQLLFDMAYANPLDKLIDPDAVPPCRSEAEARLDLALCTFLHGIASSTRCDDTA